MRITKKWFADITTGVVAAAATMDAWVSPLLADVLEAVRNFDGNLEKLHTKPFLEAIDTLGSRLHGLSENASDNERSFEPWLVAHDLLLLRMHIVAAYECRVIAESILDRLAAELIQQPSKWKELTSLEFQVVGSRVVESRNAQLITGLTTIYQNLDERVASEVRPFMRGLCLAVGDHRGYQLKSAVTISDGDLVYGDYLRDKRIAIVGPAKTGLRHGDEIEDFDVVVRFNHFDSAEYTSKEFGARTDISYYTDPAFKKVVLSTQSKLRGLKFACIQQLSSFTNQQISSTECLVRGQYRRSNSVFFKSHANALQRMLFDLLRFDVKQVKAFNMDMWVTAHDSSYKARRPTMDPHMFIHHDLAANLLFTKRLVAGGALLVDDVLGRVLLLKPKDYMLRLEMIYGEEYRERQDSIIA